MMIMIVMINKANKNIPFPKTKQTPTNNNKDIKKIKTNKKNKFFKLIIFYQRIDSNENYWYVDWMGSIVGVCI